MRYYAIKIPLRLVAQYFLLHPKLRVIIQWNSKKAEFRVKFEFLKPRLETRLEKLGFSSKPDSKLDSKNSTFRVFLIGFLLNIMFNHGLKILRFEKINIYHLGDRLRSILNNTFLHDDGFFYQWSRSGCALYLGHTISSKNFE